MSCLGGRPEPQARAVRQTIKARVSLLAEKVYPPSSTDCSSANAHASLLIYQNILMFVQTLLNYFQRMPVAICGALCMTVQRRGMLS